MSPISLPYIRFGSLYSKHLLPNRSLSRSPRRHENTTLIAPLRLARPLNTFSRRNTVWNVFGLDSAECATSNNLAKAVSAWRPSTVSSAEETFYEGWEDFSQELNANAFAIFLQQLKSSEMQLNYAQRVKNLLRILKLKENQELRKKCFEIAEEHIGCVDRTLLGLSKIEMEVWFHNFTGQGNRSAEEMLDLGRQAFRFFKLDAIANTHAYRIQQQCNRMYGSNNDPVETYMAYFYKLEDKLALPVKLGGMRFYELSAVTDQQIEAAEKTIRKAEDSKALGQFLCEECAPWQSFLQQNHPKKFSKLDHKFHTKLEKLNRKLSQKQANSQSQDREKSSQKNKSLMHEREEALFNLRQKLTSRYLKSSRSSQPNQNSWHSKLKQLRLVNLSPRSSQIVEA